jgi:hypothetical protein
MAYVERSKCLHNNKMMALGHLKGSEQIVVQVTSDPPLRSEEPGIVGEGEEHDSSIVQLPVDCPVACKDLQGVGGYLPHQEWNVPVDKAQELARRMPGLHLACLVANTPHPSIWTSFASPRTECACR